MGFFDMGFWEILLILFIALIIWGPAKIPEIAKQFGKLLRALRKVSSDITVELNKEMDVDKSHPPRDEEEERVQTPRT